MITMSRIKQQSNTTHSLAVVFSRDHTPGSIALRAALWSQWSHCSILTSESTIIEATPFYGVRERPLANLLEQSTHSAIVRIPCSDPEKAIVFARSQIGKPYDWYGILGLGFRRHWASEASWFCSEFVAGALNQVDPRFRTNVWRLTPQHLYVYNFDDLAMIEVARDDETPHT